MEIRACCFLFVVVVLITFSVESEAVANRGMKRFILGRGGHGKRTFSTAQNVMVR